MNMMSSELNNHYDDLHNQLIHYNSHHEFHELMVGGGDSPGSTELVQICVKF